MKPVERTGERPGTYPKKNTLGAQGDQSNSPSHTRNKELDFQGTGQGLTGDSAKASRLNREGSNRAASTPQGPQTQGQTTSNSQQKIMITGDDILIEYVTRLMKMFSSNKIREEELSSEQQTKIEKFITHYVWYAQDKNKGAKAGTAQPQT